MQAGSCPQIGYEVRAVEWPIRRAFASHCHALELADADVIETQLGHSVGTTIRRNYDKSNKLPQRLALLEAWCAVLAEPSRLASSDVLAA